MISELQEHRIIIWGTAVTANILFSILSSLGISPKLFLDSNETLLGQTMNGVEILSPKHYLESNQSPNDIIVMGMREPIAIEARKNSCISSNDISLYTMQELLRYMRRDYSILEIGPSGSPFFKGENVKYFDAFGPDELRKEAARYNRSPNGVPEVIDYISPNGDWTMVQDKFSCIYSSHLIEHQPDLVFHLQNVYQHLKCGGEYLLVIPDKRYCFNHYQPETTTSDVLLAYYEKRRNHSPHAWFYSLMPAHNDAVRHWRGDHGEKPRITMQAYERLISEYTNSLVNNQYVDMHEWFFTPEGFVNICENLRAMNLINFIIKEVVPTEKDSLEFYVALRKR